MHKVRRMTQAPAQCLLCGRGNIPDDPDTMDDMWFLDLERDVNWGDPTYLCKYCCERVGVMAGLVGMQELKEAQDVNRVLQRKVHDLRADLAVKAQRLDRITQGSRAIKRERKERDRETRGKAVETLKTKAKERAKDKKAAADD